MLETVGCSNHPNRKAVTSAVCRVVCTVNLSVIQHNIATLLGVIPKPCAFMAVVKGNAYGHGAVPIAHTALASGAHCLGVGNIEEALQLRRELCPCSIYLMSPFEPGCEEEIVRHDIRPFVANKTALCNLGRAAEKLHRNLDIDVHTDTGMGRAAAHIDQVPELAQCANRTAGLRLVSLSTHFPTPNDQEATDAQLAQFLHMADRVSPNRQLKLHAAASIAVLRSKR